MFCLVENIHRFAGLKCYPHRGGAKKKGSRKHLRHFPMISGCPTQQLEQLQKCPEIPDFFTVEDVLVLLCRENLGMAEPV